jgi:sec-independent protein translocase protein TatB
VFGLGFGEFLVLLLVAMIVLGPRELPRYLRKAGQFAGRMRRMAYEMREKSGIDDVIRSEGLDRDIAEIRRLTRGELTGLNTVLREATNFSAALAAPPSNGAAQPATAAPASAASPAWLAEPLQAPVPFKPTRIVVDRVHEYPAEGPDAYGALPDTAAVYDGGLAPSPLAEDPLYARGDDAPPLRGDDAPPLRGDDAPPAQDDDPLRVRGEDGPVHRGEDAQHVAGEHRP